MRQFITFATSVLLCIGLFSCEKEATEKDPPEIRKIPNLETGTLEEIFEKENMIIANGPWKIHIHTTGFTRSNQFIETSLYDQLTDEYYLVIRNGNVEGNFRVSNTEIYLDDNLIFDGDDFSDTVTYLESKVNIAKTYSLFAKINDERGGLLTLWIVGIHPGPGSAFLPEIAFPGESGEIIKYELFGEEITCELINDKIVFQDDMILTEEQIESSTLKGSSIKGFTNWRWPNNTIIYDIDPQAPHQDTILAAINEIQSLTNLRFKKRQNELSYVCFVEGNGYSSHVGRTLKRQEIEVVDLWLGESKKGSIMHEILHTAGMIHEMQRSDRNSYVIIWEKNIIDKKEKNFELFKKSLNTDSFDFTSIMMYGPEDWAIYGAGQTITKLDGSHDWKKQRKTLSAGDIEMINLMYPNIENEEPPVADFDVTMRQIFLEETIQFIDLSTNNPTSWQWGYKPTDWETGWTYFGTNVEQPTLNFDSAGIYDIFLWVKNDFGEDEEIKYGYMKVYDNYVLFNPNKD